MLHSLEISCLPKDLPENIEVDVSALDIGDALNIGDVAFPEGVVATLGEDVVVALVAKARTSQASEAEEAEAAQASEAAEGGEASAEDAAAE
jgi:large subunit ribosomal protein L25